MTDEQPDKNKKRVELNPDIEAELSEILRQGAAPETEPAPRVDLPRDRTFQEDAPSVSPDVFDNPANTGKNLLEVKVTESDRETFLEALLHDTPFVLDIPVLKNSTVSIRSRTVYEQGLAYECTADLPKDQFSSKDLLLWVQRFSMATGLVAIDGEPFSSLRFEDNPEQHVENKRRMVEFVRERFLNMPYIKWQMLLSAFNIFTIKEKLLLDEIANRDFWNPVD